MCRGKAINDKGDRCSICKGMGWTPFVGRPNDVIPPDYGDLFDYADFAEEGNWPVTGGMLDQCTSFLQFIRYIKAANAQYDVTATGK